MVLLQIKIEKVCVKLKKETSKTITKKRSSADKSARGLYEKPVSGISCGSKVRKLNAINLKIKLLHNFHFETLLRKRKLHQIKSLC